MIRWKIHSGVIGLIFGLWVHWLIISGATVAIFEFPSGTPKKGPLKKSGARPPKRPQGPFFGGSRWKFENRYGGATYNQPMYSQPKNWPDSPSGSGCRGGASDLGVSTSYISSSSVHDRLSVQNISSESGERITRSRVKGESGEPSMTVDPRCFGRWPAFLSFPPLHTRTRQLIYTHGIDV